MKKFKFSLRQKINFSLGFSLFLIILFFLITLAGARAYTQAVDNRKEVYNSLLNSTRILSDLTTTETGQRAFLLTGSEIYLQQYQTGHTAVLNDLASLNTLIASYSEVQKNILIKITPLINQKLAELEKTIQLQKQNRHDEAVSVVMTNQGQLLMDQIRAGFEEIDRSANSALAQTEGNRISGYNITVITMSIGTLIIVLVGLFALIATNREIKARIRATQALEQSERKALDLAAEKTALVTKLETSNHELENFASVASHDLQEPLRKVIVFSERIKARYTASLDATGLDYLNRMQNSTRRMQVLINDLLDFSRVMTKGQPFQSVELDKVAQEVLDDLETRIEQLDGRVELDKLPCIEADPLQMRQLLQNLLGNALKFNQPGQHPLIKVWSQPSPSNPAACELVVKDNGIGFEEKYADRIFGLFQRLHGRLDYEGTGIGLAICQKIAQRHGGGIIARSLPGQGATFIVTLPYKRIEPNETAPIKIIQKVTG